MTWLGILLMVVGGGVSALMFMGLAPEVVYTIPFGMGLWIGVAIAGLVLVVFNRRPGN